MATEKGMKQSRREFLLGAAMAGAASLSAGCMSTGGSANGCASMAGFTVKPMNRIRVAMVGVGGRGYYALTRLVLIPGIEITALCDLKQDRIDRSQKLLAEKGKPKVKEFLGPEAYKRLAQDRALEALNEACESGEVLHGTVSNATTGGLSVMKDGVRIFIPASLVGENFVKDLSKFVGEDIEFRLIECNPRKRRVIGDRKSILKERREAAENALFESIQEGMIVTGTVKNLTDFGAFIDIGGADGLLHISEMSWGRLEHPKKVFKVGQEVECFIKSIKGKKIGLSMKFPDQNPWLDAEEKYAIGNVVTGKVARMTDFGAFVELAPGVDALLHVSQIGKDRVNKPSDVLQLGQEIEAKVVEFNGADKKISISIKALEMDRPAEEKATIEVPEAIAAAVKETEKAAAETAEEVKEAAPEAAPEA